MMFALRHPNIIGLYAWFKIEGTVTQIGMVIELASKGDLMGLYQEKSGLPFSLETGVRILLGVAKGIAHMHSMPAPIVHRDIKSMNIMIMDDGVTGKLGDCGESRRVVSAGVVRFA